MSRLSVLQAGQIKLFKQASLDQVYRRGLAKVED